MFTGRRKTQVRSPFRAQLNNETVEYILETTREKSIVIGVMFSSVGSGNDEEQWWAAGAKEMGKVVAVGDFSGLSKCRY